MKISFAAIWVFFWFSPSFASKKEAGELANRQQTLSVYSPGSVFPVKKDNYQHFRHATWLYGANQSAHPGEFIPFFEYNPNFCFLALPEGIEFSGPKTLSLLLIFHHHHFW